MINRNLSNDGTLLYIVHEYNNNKQHVKQRIQVINLPHFSNPIVCHSLKNNTVRQY